MATASLVSMRRDGMLLEGLPNRFRTLAVCLDAAKQDGFALAFAPAKLRTPETCAADVHEWGRALESVPDGLHALQTSTNSAPAAPPSLKGPLRKPRRAGFQGGGTSVRTSEAKC